jgi:hypothetical protein
MKAAKARVTVTIDPSLVKAGNDAVAEGRADSLSGWVNQALAERAAKEHRLRMMAAAIADYERKHGEISVQEIEEQARADRQGARVVRGPVRARTRSTRAAK